MIATNLLRVPPPGAKKGYIYSFYGLRVKVIYYDSYILIFSPDQALKDFIYNYLDYKDSHPMKEGEAIKITFNHNNKQARKQAANNAIMLYYNDKEKGLI